MYKGIHMLTIFRTNSEDPGFVHLVRLLDEDLARKNSEQNSFYSQFNKIAVIKHVVVAQVSAQAIACGAIKEYEPGVMEIKRMFTLPEYRGKGVASQVLVELETWAKEMSYGKCILETGRNMPEPIRLYKKNGYKVISNYGQYAGVQNSICFEKILAKAGS